MRSLVLFALLATSASAQVISVNTVWSSNQTLTGDVRVEPGVTLTINPGVIVTANVSDTANLGTDPSRVELIVRGALVVNGATLTSAGTSAGTWAGVRVETGGTATLTSTTVEEAVTGLDTSAAVVVTGSTLRTNSTHVRVNTGATGTVSGSLLTASSTAVSGNGGSLTLHHCTLVANSYGVVSGSSSGGLTVNDSIIANHSSYGVYRASTSYAAISMLNDDVWGSATGDYYNTAVGSGSFSANPLFVGAPNYRLTSNSPARFSDTMGADLGAFPYTGDATSSLTGTLWANTTLASGTVTGDLTIPSGVTVTLPPGVTLTTATSDLMQSGSDTSRVEVIVKGTLSVTGSSASQATLTSSGASAGAWVGVVVQTGGTLSGAGLVVERATFGIDSVGSVTLATSTLRNNSTGARVNAGAAGNIGTTLFTGNSTAVHGNGGSLTIDHSTIVSNSYGVISSSSGGGLTVNNSLVTHQSSYGLYRASTSYAAISSSNDDVWGNATGDYYNTSVGAGSFSANPLYVGAPNYRLTSNSPARFSDSTGMSDCGAFPYSGDATSSLTGTLWTSTVLSTGTVTGDLTIPTGVTVTLPAGVTLTTATSDLMQAGDDTSRVELIVKGTLSVTGTPTLAGIVTSSGASAGSWVGVRVAPGGSLSGSGLVVERATWGVDLHGSVNASGATLRNNGTGVRTNVGGTGTLNTSLFTGNSTAVHGNGGALTVDHGTIVSNSYGVISSSSSGGVSIDNSIIANQSSYGLYRASTSYAVIANTFDDVWGNASGNYYNVSPGIGALSSNPLFVGAPNYRLTSHSPARRSDSSGTGDLGAFPFTGDATSGLAGTVWTSGALATGTLAGDLVIPAGVNVTIPAGVTLTAATSDLMQAGTDTSRVEVIVRGTLTISGSGLSPVTFTSSGAAAGAWVGVIVEAGGTLSASGAVVERATVGLDLSGTVNASASTVRNNTTGARTNLGASGTLGTTLFTGNSTAVHGNGGALTIDHGTLVSNSYGVVSSSSSGGVTINNSIVANQSSYGLYRASTSYAAIANANDDVWGNASGNYYNVSAGAGSFSANPLFVGAPNYRLTSNSPARFSDSTGLSDMGAFPYSGDATSSLTGTLWTNTVLATGTVTGDLTVPAGVTVSVPAGVTLTAATSDLMQAGDDTSRVEVIVRGTLATAGTVATPATFTSSGASAGAWVGVRVEAGGNATLTGASISRATWGVDAFGAVALTDSALTNDATGVRTNAGATVTATRAFFSGNSTAVHGNGGSVSVDHSTLVSNSYGVISSSSSGSVSVINSIVANQSSYGLYRASTSYVAISNSYNDVWGNASGNYYTVSAGTGSLSANPLFVGAPNYRLTSNSPARKSDTMGNDLGAFAYVSDATVGLVGTLWTTTTLGTSATLLGDLTVAPGVTVTVAPGVVLTAPASDLMQAGDDTSRTELIVNGTLQLAGSAGNPAVLTSTGSAGTWVGVRVPAGGTASISNATISRGSICLDLVGNSTVTASRITSCSTGVRSTGGTHSLTFTVLDANSSAVIGQGGALTLDHLTAYANSYAVISSSSGGAVGVTNSIFTNQSSYGLYRGSTSYAPITNSYNLFNANASGNAYSVTLGTNTQTADPLLVSPSTGDFHLTAGSPARGTGTSASDLGAFPFAPGAVDHLVIAPASATVAAGGTFTFTATAYDVANNPVPAAPITWSALASAGVINGSGVLTASCTPGSLTAAVTATSNGRSASANLTITTAPIASLVLSPANATVRSQQTQQFTVTARDVCNNPVSTSPSWSVTGSAGIVDATGLYTAGCSRGAYPMAIVATVGSVTGRASVTVDPGVLSTVSLSPGSATVAINATRQFTGSAADGCGNPLTPTLSYTTNVTGATVSAAGLFTAGTTPGTFATGVTTSATEGAITRSASAAVTVTGGAIASVMVMPTTATLPTGGTASFSAIALDSAGNMVAGAPTWSVVAGGGSINAGTGAFTAGTTAGTFSNTVRATIAGVSGLATVIVQPGAITRVAVSPANVTLAPAGSTTFTAQAFDANNNVVTAPVTWAATSASGAITQGGVFTAGAMSGNYPAAVTATIGGVSGNASVVINAGALAQLSVTPSVATTQAGGTLAFSASGQDGNGNTVMVNPTWTIVAGGGTISPSGVFSAGTTTGTFANTVRAEQNGVTAFATVAVTAGPLVRIELTPASGDLLSGEQLQFTGAGKDAFGNPVAATLTWTTNPAAGSVTPTGLFTAGTTAGDFADAVRATSGVVSAVASVRVRELMQPDAGSDAGVDAGLVDAGEPDGGGDVDAGVDGGPTEPGDAGTTTMPDGGTGTISGKSGCGCAQVDAFLPLFGLALLALRRRR